MIAPVPSTGYSAKVRLHLVVGDSTFEVSQMGPTFVHLRHQVELPPGEGVVVMHVDDFERRWTVSLPEGASRDSKVVRTVPLEA